MKINVTVIFKNKETQKEETSQLTLNKDEIACLYRDQYGTYLTVRSGKSYKVTETLLSLQESLCLV